MTATIIITAIALLLAFAFFNSDVWEEMRKRKQARPRRVRPRPSSIKQVHKDIFKPLI